MYDYPFELGVDIRNCYDDKDIVKFMRFYNSKNPKTEDEHAEAIKYAFRKCATLPSSFSFKAVATVNVIDKDREKVTVDSVKEHMDLYLRYGGNINWEHRDLVTGKVWDWSPATVKRKPGVIIWGNLYGGRDIYDKVRKSFVSGRNGFSLGGQAPATGYKCDSEGCYIQREVSALYEISVTANPANPLARTLEYNPGVLAKSARDGGIELTLESYEIHRDYTTCPIMKVKHQLEEDGLLGLHATKQGVEVPISWNDALLKRYIGEKGYVLSKCDTGVLFQDREWATEQAFKSLYERGLVMPDGTVSQKLEKSEFQDLYSKGILALDGSGKAKIDKTVIYQGAIL